MQVKFGFLTLGSSFIGAAKHLNNVPDDELADSLVLGHALKQQDDNTGHDDKERDDGEADLGAVGAADVLDVAPAVLVPAMVPPLGGHPRPPHVSGRKMLRVAQMGFLYVYLNKSQIRC